mgnify:FL=1
MNLTETDEAAWMFVAVPRAPTFLEKAAAKLFDTPPKWQFDRSHVRVTVRGGQATIFIHETDDPDELPLHMFDLSSVVNVSKLSLSAAEALQFLTFDEKGEALVEPVYGQIALVLNMANLGELALAFGTSEDRDAWSVWFSELVVLRDLHEMEIQANEATLPPPDFSSVLQFQTSREGRKSVREFSRTFLQAATGGRSRPEVAPNKGKLEVRDPSSKSYRACTVTAKMHGAELHFDVRRTKGHFLSSFGAPVPPLQIVESARIIAMLPWSTEFQVIVDEHNVWSFRVKSVEVRNAFVQWMRLVKGRGKGPAQTELETFPFLTAADAAMQKAHAASEKVRLQFLTDNNVQSRAAHDDDSDDHAVDAAVLVPSPAPSPSPSPPRRQGYEEDDCVDLLGESGYQTPRSSDSVGPHSVKRFTFFPSHPQTFVRRWVELQSAVHFSGRITIALTTLRATGSDATSARQGPRNASPNASRVRWGSPRKGDRSLLQAAMLQRPRAHMRGSQRLKQVLSPGQRSSSRPWATARSLRDNGPAPLTAIAANSLSGTAGGAVATRPHHFSDPYGIGTAVEAGAAAASMLRAGIKRLQSPKSANPRSA